MRSLKISLLLFVVFVAASCSFTHESSLAEDKYQISEIMLERSGTWGLKSGYKLVLHRNGSGEYTGDVDAKRKGKYQGKISRDQFELLARLIAANDFLLLKDKYHALVKDTDTVMVSIQEGAKHLRISEGAGAKS